VNVHPVADLFPMLADDELAELAADIKQRGLLQPIVLDSAGCVLDGRNRLAACRMAGVEPQFITYEGDDPDGYALAVNIARRHLSKGQKALVMARAEYKNYTEAKISKQYVSWARTVDLHAPDLAARVLEGTMPLSDAYEEARERKREAEEAKVKLDRLRVGAPDLLSLVDDERMSLDNAVAALNAREEKVRTEEQERERKQAEEQRDARALLGRIVELVGPQSMSDGFIDAWVDRLGEIDAEFIKRTEQAGRVLLDLAERAKR
jgi:ParB-like chromosome segregation protein Spo0J